MTNKPDDIDPFFVLLDEKKPKTITYSKSFFYLLTRNLPSDYTAKPIVKNDSLVVPYTIIKKAKIAKEASVREIVLLASERPDRNTTIRSTLDLWGLSSYVDYLYTTGELGFLEGLVPMFEGGFLSPAEIKKMSEILAFLKILIPSSELAYYQKKYGADYAQKYREIRLKMLEWSGKLQIPVIAGIIIGSDGLNDTFKKTIETIYNAQQRYKNAHSLSIQSEILLQNGQPDPQSDENMLKALAYIQSMKMDAMISIPTIHMHCVDHFIDAGIRDFGSIPINPQVLFPKAASVDFDALAAAVAKRGFTLHQRLPIKYDAIRNGIYSKKLGQVFDSYRYKIKKYEQEHVKDIKLSL